MGAPHADGQAGATGAARSALAFPAADGAVVLVGPAVALLGARR